MSQAASVPSDLSPSANHSTLNGDSYAALQSPSFLNVLNRLDAIESFLALDAPPSPAVTQEIDSYSNAHKDPSLPQLWAALAKLRRNPRKVRNGKVWSEVCVKQLWLE